MLKNRNGARSWLWLILVVILGGLIVRSWLLARPFKGTLEESPPNSPLVEARAAASTGLADAGGGGFRGPSRVSVAPSVATSDEVAQGRAQPISNHRLLGRTANTLLLGLDRNPGVRRGGLTDTLIVAAMDEERGQLGLVSVPRDLFVEYPGQGRVRINAVYALARREKQDPLEALGRVMEDTLGIPIQHTVVIDLSVLERVVDVLGGVEIDVPCPIIDRFIDPRLEGGRRLLDVRAGRQLMDGPTVAMYVRSRHGRSDWNRSLRQQAVLFGLRERLVRGRTLLRLPELMAEVEASVQSDLSRLSLLSLARQALSIEPRRLHGVVLGRNETVPMRTEQQWSVLLGDDQAIEQRLSDLFVAPRPGREPEPCPAADVALRKSTSSSARSTSERE